MGDAYFASKVQFRRKRASQLVVVVGLPFDVAAIDERGEMRRGQVRYRASVDAAHLRCRLGGWWADRHGNHHRAFDASAIDVLAIYCPAPTTFVYLLADELTPAQVNLLLSRAKNGQVRRTRDASEYRDPWRMFGPAAHVSEKPLAKVGVGTPS